MKSVQLVGQFGEENLQVTSERVPFRDGVVEDESLLASEVEIKISSASLNYRDLLMIRGQYNKRQPLPFVPCSDGAGEVLAVGSQVTRFEVGDLVCPTFVSDFVEGLPNDDAIARSRGGPLPGMLRERAYFAERDLVKIPVHLSAREASTLPCAALTAWTALVEEAQIRAGQTVLVLGSGGVSLFALQIAKMHGCRVIATTSTKEKATRLEALGADVVLNYKNDERWGTTCKKQYSGADVVVEVGGAGTLQQSLAAVKTGGHVSLIGVLAGAASSINLLPVLMRHVRVQGAFVGSRSSFERMCRAFSMHELHPILDEVFSLPDVKRAFSRLAAAEHFGKITLNLD
ncbi:MAG: NAD(P)-dependent alcohol dehydrogenase [Deltaproteobacteria bacterium]|nr:NAD(P)-dependent alcohol dehydrogenase [Deltaproteobacteria bacterium]